MRSVYVFFAITTICLGSLHASKGDHILAAESPAELLDLRQLLQPVFTQKSLASSHDQQVRLLDVIYGSRWRNSIPRAVVLLVGSSVAEERKAGWQLAKEHGYRMNWTKADIDRIINEPEDKVKLAAISSVATTDASWLTELIEQILDDPASTTECKSACVLRLNKVPTPPHRVRLWQIAARDKTLRAECISAFSSVRFSDSAIDVLLDYLSDISAVHVAVSDHLGRPSEIRILACQALATVDVHKDRVVEELLRQCEMPPDTRHLDFCLASMVAIHRLSPSSSKSQDQLVHWYDILTESRPLILQTIEGEFPDSSRFESLVISTVQDMSPGQKCCVSRWLSGQKSNQAIAMLRELLGDSHPGVRVAAAVALTKVDPLFDLSPVREQLLKSAVLAPEEFVIAFDSMTDAVSAIALAGQSDEDAMKWLNQGVGNPELRSLCDEAMETLSFEISLKNGRYVRWRDCVETTK